MPPLALSTPPGGQSQETSRGQSERFAGDLTVSKEGGEGSGGPGPGLKSKALLLGLSFSICRMRKGRPVMSGNALK